MNTNVSGDQILQNVVSYLLSPLYQLCAAIAIVYFLYGAMKFVMDLNDPEKKNVGKNHLLYGTIGLFIILSVGGLLRYFNEFFGGMFIY